MYAFRSLAIRRTPIFSHQVAQRAGLHQSIPRCAGKESALHHEGRAEEVESEKQDLLRKQKDGKGHWKEELASDSESVVKADRGEVEASEETIKKLQKEAEKAAKK
ncbi:hypothetical protein BS50DRAFT_629159 [Corynespora cassiicola Philippines]|uniref:Mitochondrial carrier protein pet8 n=1 Tax=Corynespora cassiicola Philippines TaxID=1448308 RepID=A0A2T2P673_CORCC|nr:hypothetical protein BS50DRAFT_629159 [Corynespora cassiicola Philippines]